MTDDKLGSYDKLPRGLPDAEESKFRRNPRTDDGEGVIAFLAAGGVLYILLIIYLIAR